MSQRSTAQHYNTDTPFCTIRKSHVTWNFAVPGPLASNPAPPSSLSYRVGPCTIRSQVGPGSRLQGPIVKRSGVALLFLWTLGIRISRRIGDQSDVWRRPVLRWSADFDTLDLGNSTNTNKKEQKKTRENDFRTFRPDGLHQQNYKLYNSLLLLR